MNNFKKQLKEYEQLINSKINELLVYPDSDLSPLTEAMLYSLNIGGKRIRPIIMLEFYKLCGGNNSGIYNFAVALEMIHTYSLVHDDLPCMDNDDFRRGKPSCHKAFNEATAVLAGDALLTDAFRLAADTNIEQNCVIKAIKILAECAGVNGMIGGQIIDINNQDNEISLQKLKKLYRLKTGALIVSAAKIGCILAGNQGKLDFAEKYAQNIGLAFQIVDDILDATGNPEILGKPVGSDQKNNKSTFVSLLGLNECQQTVANLTAEAKAVINEFEGNGQFLKDLADYLAQRNY
ncbi:MAG: polyprenyl synthetase family protein [Clostridia bacterium]|nr:polyprenyl synthetase family protein [Clostridia bacterium]